MDVWNVYVLYYTVLGGLFATFFFFFLFIYCKIYYVCGHIQVHIEKLINQNKLYTNRIDKKRNVIFVILYISHYVAKKKHTHTLV